MKALFIGAVIALLCTPPVLPKTKDIEGTVTLVHDGDTIRIIDGKHEEWNIRLAEVDAPEMKQPYGMLARDVLKDLVWGKKVTVKNIRKDSYKRKVGRVFVGSQDVAAFLVDRGYAWWDCKYSTDVNLYEKEFEARQNKRGLWLDSHPVAPWNYRLLIKQRDCGIEYLEVRDDVSDRT